MISIICTVLSIICLCWLVCKVKRRGITRSFVLALILYLIAIVAIVARYALPIWSPPRLLIVVVSVSLLELQLYYFVFSLSYLKCQLEAENYLDFELKVKTHLRLQYLVMTLCFVTNAVKCYTEVTLAN